MTDLGVRPPSGPAAEVAPAVEGAGGRTVPFPVTEPDRVPVARYYDRDFAELEQRYLWSRTWQMACRLEELPDLGDYVEYAVGDQSVLLVRTDTDTVAGYLNACRHRATELAKGTGTFPRGQIICPFHGWRWNLDGTSSFVFGRHAFDPSLITAEELCLRPVRVETWGGSAWINLDPSAPPLLEALDPIPGLLDPLGVADMRVVWWKSVVLPANWKMAQEAFMEGYHVPGTHPQLTLGHPEQYDPDSLSYAVHPNGHSSFQLRPNAQAKKGRDVGVNEIDAILESVHLLSKGLEAMTLDREVRIFEALRGRPVPEGSTFGAEMIRALYRYAGEAGIPLPAPDPATLARWGGMFYLFPNYFVLPQYGNALVYRSRPYGDDPERCLFELWSISIPAADDEVARPVLQGPFEPDDADHWPRIPLQDFSTIGRQQRGIHSRSVDALRLSRTYEGGIANMHRELDRYLARP